jgi:Cu/Zn superoxide dismutase
MKRAMWLGLLGTLAIGSAQAATEKVAINLVSADGAPQAIGSVTISETAYGLGVHARSEIACRQACTVSTCMKTAAAKPV